MREVSYEEGESLAKSHGVIFLETSAKTGDNFNDIFVKSVEQIDIIITIFIKKS